MALIIIIAAIAVITLAVGLNLFLKIFLRPEKKGVGVSLRGLKAEHEVLSSLNGIVAETRKWFYSLPVEKLETVSFDGTKLCAEYLPLENARGTVILFHSYRSSGTRDFALSLKLYRELGLNIVVTKLRSCGESGGKYSTFGIKERYDCLEWCKKVCETDSDLPIFLSGISLGCATVLFATELSLPENVHGIIADCGFCSPWTALKDVLNHQYHLPAQPLLSAINFWARILGGFNMRKCDTVRAMKKNNVPVLFVHGGMDEFVPKSCTLANYEACAAEKKLFISEKAMHTLSFYENPEEYSALLREFIESHMEKR